MFADEELVSACKEYNPLAQKMLCEKYGAALLGICLRYAKNKMDADDIFQEGFIKILTKIEVFKWQGKGSLEAWMNRIIVNTAISSLKKIKHQESIELVEDLIFETDEEENTLSDTNWVEDVDFSHGELLEALIALPDDFRLVFNMHVIDGLKHEEIAERLNINIRTSRSRLLRARKKIQKQLLESCKNKTELIIR